jgi:hypothetical protein
MSIDFRCGTSSKIEQARQDDNDDNDDYDDYDGAYLLIGSGRVRFDKML